MSANCQFQTAVVSNGGLYNSITPYPNLAVSNTSMFFGDVSLNNRLFLSSDVSLNARLSIAGDASFNNRLFINTGALVINGVPFSVTTAYTSDISTTGNLTVTNKSATGSLDVTSSVTIGGALAVTSGVSAASYNATSDYRIKTNIIQLNGNFVVDNLKPIQYYNVLSKTKDIGFLAHEVQ
jgi:hypothetical protein